jgi:hypothetical protein
MVLTQNTLKLGRSMSASPEDVDPLDAVPLTCAGVTTYKAVKLSGANYSDLGVPEHRTKRCASSVAELHNR